MYNSEFIPPPNDPLAIEVFIGLKEFNGLPSRYLPATLANQLAAAIASGATVFQLLNQAGKQICERAFPGERDGEFANVLAWTAVKIRNSHWKVRDIVDVNWIPWEQRRIGGYYGLPPSGISARPFILRANSQATGAARWPGRINPKTGRRIWREELEKYKHDQKIRTNQELAEELGVSTDTLKSFAASDKRHGLGTEKSSCGKSG
jgi:hypothetical protein